MPAIMKSFSKTINQDNRHGLCLYDILKGNYYGKESLLW